MRTVEPLGQQRVVRWMVHARARLNRGPDYLIGVAILCHCRLQRVSGGRPVASRVRLSSTSTVGVERPARLGSCIGIP